MSRPMARLGRGLASLIPDTALDLDEELSASLSLRTVPLDEIVPNPEQPRKVFDAEALEDLADSLKAHGVLSPLVVRREGGRYVLIAGERRLRAAGLAGLSEVPVVVHDTPQTTSDEGQLVLALVENLQREDLDPIDAALGYSRLVQSFGLTQEQVAQKVGKRRSTVANALRLLKLPPFAMQAVRDGQVSAGHARALVPLADAADDLRRVLAKVIAQQLNVRATERLVAQITATPTPVRRAARQKKDQTYDYAQKLLTEALRSAVTIQPRRNGGGRIVVDYGNGEELERLIGTLRNAG